MQRGEDVSQLMHMEFEPRHGQIVFHSKVCSHAIERDVRLTNQARHPQHLKETSVLPQVAKTAQHEMHCEFLQMTRADQIDQQVNDILGLEAVWDEDRHA